MCAIAPLILRYHTIQPCTCEAGITASGMCPVDITASGMCPILEVYFSPLVYM